MKALYISAVLNIACSVAVVAAIEPADTTKLNVITNRGKALAEYEEACGRASNAVNALSKSGPVQRRLFASKDGVNWKIVFGRSSRDGRIFVIDYEATWMPGTEKAVARHLNPPRIDATNYVHWSKAIDTVIPYFKTENKINNYAIFPSKGNFWVYLYPVSVQPGTWLLGGDMRFVVAGNGRQILETRQLHKSTIPYSAPPAGKTTVMSYHSAVLDSAPEETDVFHVLMRQPPAPELVVARNFVYKIYPDGSIKYIGLATDLHKGKLDIDN